jgi:aminoglycoside 3-N-acetyltransferase
MLSVLKYNIRQWCKRHLPDSVIDAVRRPSRFVRSRKRSASRETSPLLGRERLVADLSNAGIQAGDVVMVHSSLSQIGNVDGGAETVIRSLIDVVTTDGTIMMPAYNSADRMIRDLKQGELMDLRSSRSGTGAITESFRTWPDVFRSSHPFSSVCAWGMHARYVTADHATGPEVCHADSPVARLVELKGKVIGIGISIAQGLGVAHYLEDTWDGFPFEVHTGCFPVTYIDCDGTRVSRDICRFDPTVSRTRIDNPQGTWILRNLTAHLAHRGILKRFPFGEADSWIMEAEVLHRELKRLAAKDVTMYLTEDQLTDRNRDIENW